MSAEPTLRAPGAPAYWLLSRTTRLSDRDLRRMAAAFSVQLARDLAPEWGLVPPTVTVASQLSDIPDDGVPVAFLPDIGMPDADAYHSLTPDGRDYCRVQADAAMSFDDITEAGSHELCEDSNDRPCNRWATRTDASGNSVISYALEVCDGLEGTPEEGGSYTIDLSDDGAPVRVANFCGRAWFADEPLRGAKLDFLGRLSRPWQLLSPTSSYAVTMVGATTVMLPVGKELPARKRHPAARTAKRLRQGMKRQRRIEVIQRYLRGCVRQVSVVLLNMLLDACERFGEDELYAVLADTGSRVEEAVERLERLEVARPSGVRRAQPPV